MDLGDAQCALGQVDAGIESYRQSIRVRPSHAKAMNNLASALVLQGRWEEAVEQYRRAVAVDPRFAEAYANLGNVLKKHGRREEAVAAFRAALGIRPDDLTTLNRLGYALLDLGREHEAVACYRRAIAVAPDSLEAYNNLGAVLGQSHRFEEAAAVCRQGLARQPGRAEVPPRLGDPGAPEKGPNFELALLENLGTACRHMGLLDEAADVFRRCLPFYPDNPFCAIRAETLCPPVAESIEAIDAYHQRLHAVLDRFGAMRIRIDPMKVANLGCEPPFERGLPRPRRTGMAREIRRRVSIVL